LSVTHGLTHFQIWSRGWARLSCKNRKVDRKPGRVWFRLTCTPSSGPLPLISYAELLRQEKKVLVSKSANTSRSPDGQYNQGSAVYRRRGNTSQNPCLSRGEKKICRHADARDNRLPNDLGERNPTEEPRDWNVVLETIHQSRYQQRDGGPTQAEEADQGPAD